MPHVTVVIPAYNQGAFVLAAVRSVLAQTYRDLGVVVVDDGSHDDTAERLARLTDRRLAVVRQTNAGAAAARNRGMQVADGDLVAFLDADDAWRPDKLRQQVQLLDARPAVGLVYTGYHVVAGAGRVLATRPARPAPARAFERLLLENYVAGSASTAVVRRRCLDAAGMFDPALRGGEDWDLWLRLARVAALAAIPAPLACIRLHARNATAGAAELAADLQRVLDRHLGAAPPGLRRRARARAAVVAGVLAHRRGDRRLTARLAWRALAYHPLDRDAAALLLKGLLGVPPDLALPARPPDSGAGR